MPGCATLLTLLTAMCVIAAHTFTWPSYLQQRTCGLVHQVHSSLHFVDILAAGTA